MFEMPGVLIVLPILAENKLDNSLGGMAVAVWIDVNLPRGIFGRIASATD